MVYVRLSSLPSSASNPTICIRVTRLWHQRCGLERAPVKYIHMVLTDAQGYSMYARVDSGAVGRFVRRIEEGSVYDISKFLAIRREYRLKPVRTPHTILFTGETIVQNPYHQVPDIPRWTYSLTALSDLPAALHLPRYLVDVIGVLTRVSNLCAFYPNTRSTPIFRRDIFLTDHRSGQEARISLIGNAAERFVHTNVHADGHGGPPVAIFTACLVKRGYGLYGNVTVGWHINKDMYHINTIRSELHNNPTAIVQAPFPADHAPFPADHVLWPQPDGHMPSMPIDGLINFDLFCNQDARFGCTVNVYGLLPGSKWCFRACVKCGQPAISNGPNYPDTLMYTCSDDSCDGVEAELRYRLTVIASDSTSAADFRLTGNIAEQLMALRCLRSC